jgi:hypothetical protein
VKLAITQEIKWFGLCLLQFKNSTIENINIIILIIILKMIITILSIYINDEFNS